MNPATQIPDLVPDGSATSGRGQKPWIQGKIANLPPKQRALVHQWFRENLTYPQMQRRFKEEFGDAIGRSSLSRYYSKHRLELDRIAQSSEVEIEVVSRIQTRPELRLLRAELVPMLFDPRTSIPE